MRTVTRARDSIARATEDELVLAAYLAGALTTAGAFALSVGLWRLTA